MCESGCGCESGHSVTYGFDGSEQLPAGSFETTPMSVPMESDTFGQ